MTQFKPVTDSFAVAPQIAPEDVAAAVAAGFTRIVNNRPDGEQEGQPASAEIEAAARRAGLAYTHAPIASSPTYEAVEAVGEAIAEGGKTLAFCRSGTRSVTLWALAQAQAKALPVEEILARAAAAGYDLSGWRPTLSQLSQP
jgi:uncharacterized protein (TIGR01244 family)